MTITATSGVIASPPLFLVSLLLFIKVSYEVISGKLLNGRQRIWLTRVEGPRTYWGVVALEAAAVFGGFYVALLW